MNLIDVNQALRIYLGSDQNGGVEPYGMVARVEARYGSNASTVIAELEGAFPFCAPSTGLTGGLLVSTSVSS